MLKFSRVFCPSKPEDKCRLLCQIPLAECVLGGECPKKQLDGLQYTHMCNTYTHILIYQSYLSGVRHKGMAFQQHPLSSERQG